MRRSVLVARFRDGVSNDARWFHVDSDNEIDDAVERVRDFVGEHSWEPQGCENLPCPSTYTTLEKLECMLRVVFSLEHRFSADGEDDAAQLARELWAQIRTWDPGEIDDYIQECFVGVGADKLDVVLDWLNDTGFFEGVRDDLKDYFNVERYYNCQLAPDGWFSVRINGAHYVFNA